MRVGANRDMTKTRSASGCWGSVGRDGMPCRTTSPSRQQAAGCSSLRDGRILQARGIGGTLVEQGGETLRAQRVFLGVGYEIGDRAALEGRGDLGLLERVQWAEPWPYPLPALREALEGAPDPPRRSQPRPHLDQDAGGRAGRLEPG